MFRRSGCLPPTEDPCVAAVEQILTAAASRWYAPGLPAEGTDEVVHALWVCACVTQWTAPTWLIYDTSSGAITWRRVPDGCEPIEIVEAQLSAAWHADPEEMLGWLDGDAVDPWGGGDGRGGSSVLPKLRAKIRGHDRRESSA
jgi:hypothetical protein